MSRIPAPAAAHSPRLAAGRRRPSRPGTPRRELPQVFGLLLAAVALAPTTGCVALSIPSERFHDAADSGGILGSWQAADRVEPPLPPTACPAAAPNGPVETEAASGGPGAESPVPWPRFHPVPTRPVFGPASF